MAEFEHILDDRDPVRWRRAAIGAALGAAGPVIWCLVEVLLGSGSGISEMSSHLAMYMYLISEAAVVLGAFGFWLGWREDELQSRVQRFSVASITDYLTKLRNARYFWVRAREEFERADRCNHGLALIIIDLDEFSYVNDTWGHAKGDEVLQEVGAILGRKLRQYDVVARLGGEEFGILLPETTAEDAYEIAERIRKQTGSKLYFDVNKDSVFRVTASLGIATIWESQSDSMNRLFGRADAALYRAKERGGDLVLIDEGSRSPSEPTQRQRRGGQSRSQLRRSV